MSATLRRLEGEPRALVEAAIERLGSKKAVAEKIGYSRSSLSLALSGGYRSGSLDKLEQAIRDALADTIPCPHLGVDLAPAACADYRALPLQTANPQSVRHWQACRFCPHNPASHRPSGSAGSSHQPKGKSHASRSQNG